MHEYMRVNVCGRVTLAEERFSGGGRRLARLCVATGGDARKVGSVAQFDFYDEELIPLVLSCRARERVLGLQPRAPLHRHRCRMRRRRIFRFDGYEGECDEG